MPTRRDEPEPPACRREVPPKYSFARTGRGGDNQSVRAEAVAAERLGKVRLPHPELPVRMRVIAGV